MTTELDARILRYSRQIVLKAMAWVRTSMRGSHRLALGSVVENPDTEKAAENLTKAIDKDTETLMVSSLRRKFGKVREIDAFTVFSEELGIQSFPPQAGDASRFVVFMDPIDGTEFAEHLQGGWCLLAVYDRQQDEVAVAVAGDIFLDRLYWAVRGGDAEGLDFITHSWFRLDGGPNPPSTLAGARVNVLSTKVGRFRSVAAQPALLDAIEANDGRINLAWGSNLIVQVAAGYADVGLEFTKGFASYDILPGLFIAECAGLTILDLDGRPLTSQLDVDAIFASYRSDPQNPRRTPFVVAKDPDLAREVVRLLRV